MAGGHEPIRGRMHVKPESSLGGAVQAVVGSLPIDRIPIEGRLTVPERSDTLVHMEQIRIRDLHMNTGEWVRRAARGEGVVITERGRPVASLIPFEEGHAVRSFRERQVLPEFDALPEVSGDATAYVSEDRDRR